MTKSRKLIILGVFALVVIFLLAHLRAYLADRSAAKEKAVAVSVAPVMQKTVDVVLREVGTVQAYNSVSIKPRVDGEILQVPFQRGSFVKQGQLLFQIDPKPYQIALEQAQANLAKDQAQLTTVQLQEKRSQPLVKKGYVAQQDYDQIKANVQSAAATVAADQAAVQTAQLNLSYTSIIAPIAGRIGDQLVDEGNLVKASDSTVLATINQIAPIDVSFSIPEKYFVKVQQAQQQAPIQVQAKINKNTLEKGTVTLINNAVDNTTGMLTLKATFTNNDQLLWPGQYVKISIPITTVKDALLIPTRAVQEGQQGSYVYVVNSDDTVSFRPIKAGASVDDQTVVENGLKAGERVVTDGVLRLTDGAMVKVVK